MLERAKNGIEMLGCGSGAQLVPDAPPTPHAFDDTHLTQRTQVLRRSGGSAVDDDGKILNAQWPNTQGLNHLETDGLTDNFLNPLDARVRRPRQQTPPRPRDL